MTTQQHEAIMPTQSRQEAVEALFASHGMPIHLDPSVFFGWREGDSLDVRSYASRDLPHPKDPDFYDSLSDTVPDHEIWTIYKGIRDKKAIDNPVLVFLHRKDRNSEYEIFVLDGATRTSCVSHLRKTHYENFKTIPVVLFEGNLTEARGEMMRRNIANRSRALKPIELVEAVGQLADVGITEFEIGELCGIGSRSGLTRMCLNLYYDGADSLKKALAEDLFTVDEAIKLSKLPEFQQNTQVNNRRLNKPVDFTGEGTKKKRNLPLYAAEMRLCSTIEKEFEAMMTCLNLHGTAEQREALRMAYGPLHAIRRKIQVKDRKDRAAGKTRADLKAKKAKK